MDMNAIGAIIGILLFIGIVLCVVIWIAMGQREHRLNNLRYAAARYGGRLTRSFAGGDGMVFTANGVPAELSFTMGGRNDQESTTIRFKWRPPGRLRIFPETFFEKLKKMFGTQDIQIGTTAFDSQYMIQGEPTGWIRKVLDLDTRREMNRLRIMCHAPAGRGIRIEAGPAGITIVAPRCFVNERSELVSFIERADEESVNDLYGLATMRR